MEQVAVYKRYSEKIPDSMIFMVIDYLRYKEVEFIVAPYEADSQLAYLYHKKYVDFVVSEDSDMIAYNCFQLVKKLRANGECLVMNVVNKKQASPSGFLRDFMTLSCLSRAEEP